MTPDAFPAPGPEAYIMGDEDKTKQLNDIYGLEFGEAMALSNLVLLLISLFGILSFGSLSVFWIKDRRKQIGEMSPVTGVLVVMTTGWFIVNAVVALRPVYSHQVIDYFDIIMWTLVFAYPPLIMHIHYSENSKSSGEFGHDGVLPKHPWLDIVLVTYLVSGTVATLPLFFLIGWVPGSMLGFMGVAMVVLYLAAAVYAIVALKKASQQGETSEERTTRRWHFLFWALAIVVFPFLYFGGGASQEWLSVFARALPLMFVFVSFYYLQRFTFFDVFVKRGLFALFLLLVLVGYFRGLSLFSAAMGGVRVEPWLYAVTLLPVAAFLPGLYRLLETWLDRAWLGRKLAPVEAVKYFLSEVRNATSEEELAHEARDSLSAIFQAETVVSIRSGPGVPGFQSVLKIPVKLDGRTCGVIQMGRRANNMPYFSKDVSLLTSLADVLSYLIQNVSLQDRKQRDEKRQKELEVHASRSELKALRAQINPHFLFNALNAIAGLIHRNPNRAEETVEELAEIFRYTLKSSDKEWTRLEDELEFVRAYLNVERSRFGDRLQTTIEMDQSIKDVQFPVMMVQTLVENAIKHGVASVRGVGEIHVRASRLGVGLQLEVMDNGPGIEGDHPPKEGISGAGYGLKNVNERLRGYYGNSAELRMIRDEQNGLTIARIQIHDPAVAHKASSTL